MNTASEMGEAVHAAIDSVTGSIAETLRDVKPKLRGWLHLGTAPLTLAAGIVLIALSPTTMTRVGSVVFTVSALLLFTVSAIYHTGTWSPRTWAFLRRFDHSNVFILIAGSYTPITLMLLEGTQRVALLVTVWTAAILGVLFRVFWTDAPRWLYTPIYIAMGWAAVFFIPGFIDGASSRLGTGMGDRRARADRLRRHPLHARRRGLRLQVPEPLTALVRLPRGVPLVHGAGVRRPLRRHLDGDVLPALSPALSYFFSFGIVDPRPCSIVISVASCVSIFSVRENEVSASSGLNRCRAIALA